MKLGSRRLAVGLARYRLFQIPTQILKDLLLTLLNFEEDRFRHSRVVLPRMDLARLQEDSVEIAHALPRDEHLVIGLNHGSTNPQYRVFGSG